MLIVETVFWNRLAELCAERNSTPTEEVKSAGLAAGNVTYWKNGRIPNTKIMARLEEYFGVDRGYFTNPEQKEKAPATGASVEDVKFALFGTTEISDELYEKVVQMARIAAEMEARAKGD